MAAYAGLSPGGENTALTRLPVPAPVPRTSGSDARLHPEKPETLGVVAQLPAEPLHDGARATLVGRLMQPPGRPLAAAFGGTTPVPLWLRPQRVCRTLRRSTLQSTRTPPSNDRSGLWTARAAPGVAAALHRRCLSIPGASLFLAASPEGE